MTAPMFTPTPPPPTQPTETPSVLGIVTVAIAAVGAVLACIPATMYVSLFPLFVATITGVLAYLDKAASRQLAQAGLVILAVGYIIAATIIGTKLSSDFAHALLGVEDSTSRTSTTRAPAATTTRQPVAPPSESPRPGSSWDTLIPVGGAAATDDWLITVNSVTFDATEEVMAALPSNEAPPPGYSYILINLTVTYTGSKRTGEHFLGTLGYLTTEGQYVDTALFRALPEDYLDMFSAVRPKGSITGDVAVLAPAASASQGAFALSPHFHGDPILFALW